MKRKQINNLDDAINAIYGAMYDVSDHVGIPIPLLMGMIMQHHQNFILENAEWPRDQKVNSSIKSTDNLTH